MGATSLENVTSVAADAVAAITRHDSTTAIAGTPIRRFVMNDSFSQLMSGAYYKPKGPISSAFTVTTAVFCVVGGQTRPDPLPGLDRSYILSNSALFWTGEAYARRITVTANSAMALKASER